MKIAMVATEMAPLAKVGGLADVVGALPQALARLGHDVVVVLPRYASIDAARHGIRTKDGVTSAQLEAGTNQTGKKAGLTVYLVEGPSHFDRAGIYNDPKDGKGYPDNDERFIFFQRAALELLRKVSFRPDVIHCHDHQTALIPAYLRMGYDRERYFNMSATLFTVHNLGYQGLFPPRTLELAGFDRSLFHPGSAFEFYGQVNFMKIGLVYADAITTVSPTYAKEICGPEQGSGLEGVLQTRQADLYGVLNGIDDTYWHPAVDPHIKDHYTAANLKGKAACRKALLAAMDLPAPRKRTPVIGVISRLTGQKGFDLVQKVLPELMERGALMVVLGAGEESFVQMFKDAAARYPKQVAARIGFDEQLAHLIEAGSDMFLMPSRYEPCGLNQMYSLAYGTVPIVRHTGGLADTVREGGDRGNGFIFRKYDAGELLAAADRALQAFQDKQGWEALMKRGMEVDCSWSAPARAYEKIYAEISARVRGRVASAV